MTAISHALPQAQVRTLRRVYETLLPHKREVAIIAGLAVISASVGLAYPLLVKILFDDALPHHDVGLLYACVALMVCASCCGGLLQLLHTSISTNIAVRVSQHLREAYFEHLQRMSLKFFKDTKNGDIMYRLTGDMRDIQRLFGSVIPQSITNLAALLSAVVGMMLLSPKLTAISFLFLPVVAFVSLRMGAIRKEYARKRAIMSEGIASFVGEIASVNGAYMVKSFGRQDHMNATYARLISDLARCDLLLERDIRLKRFFLTIALSLVPVALFYGVGLSIAGDSLDQGSSAISIGGLFAFVSLQGRFIGPTSQLLNIQAEFQAGLSVFERVFQFLDFPGATQEPLAPVTMQASAIKGEVVFDKVTFAYPKHSLTVLSKEIEAGQAEKEAAAASRGIAGVSFAFRSGQMLAVVGPSGAGKTTISYLLQRIYTADSGAISIDGIDLRAISSRSLSEMVGVVPQETFLLHASIRENLTIALPGATDEQLFEAAKAAAIHDRIMELPLAYDTTVGERGYKLSGGEKQRLSIARTILKNPPILILDEATNSLDNESEYLVRQALGRLMAGRATLIIAHRLSTIEKADQIIVLESGRVVQRGTHSVLIEQPGLYARLHALQTAPQAA